MGVKKFVILVIISVLLIVLWGLMPAFFPEQKEFFDSWVFIVVWIALFLLPFVISFMMFRKFTGGGREMLKILKSGRPAEAVILELNESSSGGVMTINDQPVVNLVLEVHDGSKKPLYSFNRYGYLQACGASVSARCENSGENRY